MILVRGKKESKKPYPSEANTSVALRKSRRRSSNMTLREALLPLLLLKSQVPRVQVKPTYSKHATSSKQSPVRSSRRSAKKDATLP